MDKNKEEFWKALTSCRCQSCGNLEGTAELHSCPFAEEIYDNPAKECNCCDECESQCALDI